MMIIGNPSLSHPAALPFPLDQLPPTAGAAFDRPERLNGTLRLREPLDPGEVRVLTYQRARPVTQDRRATSDAVAAAKAPQIAIESASPAVEGGRFAVKRLVGQPIQVSADIIMDGHDILAAELLWRTADEESWRREKLELTVNDRWEGRFTPERVGRHVFSIAAWWDEWASYRHGLARKQEAGQDLTSDIQEGVALLRRIAVQAPAATRDTLENAADRADAVAFLSEETNGAVQAAGHRPFLTQLAGSMAVDADRPQAVFASWYEMFPRSVTNDPARHGTFYDVIREMPRIRDHGIRRAVFPADPPDRPHQPQGPQQQSARRSPATSAAPTRSAARKAATTRSIRNSARWRIFAPADRRGAGRTGWKSRWTSPSSARPTIPGCGSIRSGFAGGRTASVSYAENPPKKYEDIVNVDFYAPDAVPGLWRALRDVVQFWVRQGVRIFRVDNPHTKPLPVLAVADRRHPCAIPGRDLPGRGVHPAPR